MTTFADQSLVKLGDVTVQLEDSVVINAWLEIEKRWQWRPPKDFFFDVVENQARLNRFHPVRDYLNGLRWDGTPRADEWLIRYGGAAATPYVRAVSAIVLIASVRRVRQPGCKFDELLVLESPQGWNKSTALKKLCPREEWFCEDLPLGLDSKQIIERTTGVWIAEVAELHGSSREVEKVKAQLSRQIDGPVRLAYARLPVTRPRQFVMVGTINPSDYLRDKTGNRRFWPVEVTAFDLEALERDRDQLWAEAAAREAKGESIRLDPKYYADAAAEQEARRERDPWEDVLARTFGGHFGKVAGFQIWNTLGIDVEHQGENFGRRVGAIMRALDFKYVKVRPFPGQAQVYGWERRDPRAPKGEQPWLIDPNPPKREEPSADEEGM